MKNLLARLLTDNDGQDLIEYALLAGFISLAVIAAITAVGGGLNTLYGAVTGKLTAAAAATTT